MTKTVAPKRRMGRPPKEDSVETSNRIIETAGQLFAAQGYAATSMEQVASACNAGKDTIYRRFPSKSDLFAAVVGQLRAGVLDNLEQEITAITGSGDALERLRLVAWWFLSVNLRPEMVAFKRIAMSEAVVFGAADPDQTGTDPIMGRLVELVDDAQQEGFLRHGDPITIADHLIHSIVFGPSNHAMLGGRNYDDAAARSDYFQRAWDLFLHGAAG
ncbi:TetR/AcrR family transcriptional regulator [Thalassospira sp. TSL5-1]|uniref:TetR/AcrR family transcriptional regulator n=1 Tax=Thalassospira sp. TSL5-1 TaxID=1544451 RepID=UPI0009398549|nr:TetR/AcrR family transcriptional regulator [Thalassospira sp. TSL5-1]OKH86327.1 TetR family transcriptional regulator [Thalassospira sp. TSL5-1]